MLDGELGRFLRSRREAVRPQDVGLPPGVRRRTPGLRRAELATLAGISVDYLVRLEQGRDRHPSTQVLGALADALRLDEDDRAHLRSLAIIANGPELCPRGGRPLAQTVRPTVAHLLESLEPSPAFVVNRLSDVIAWNEPFERLARPVGLLDGDPPNVVRFMFCDPRSHGVYPDWAEIADEAVGDLRDGCAANDPHVDALVAELAAGGGDEFTTRWAAHPVTAKRSGVKLLRHPEAGDLRLAFETLQLPDGDEQRLVVDQPADAATAAALDQLVGRVPGALRVVAGSGR